MKHKQPSFQFYPGDWTKDPDLRRCSHCAKGVLMDVLCVMFECEQRGVLATTGVPWTDLEIARAIGADYDLALSGLRELLDKSVLARDETGAIYSRRMTRDERNRRTTADRVKRFRNGKSNAGVTPVSSSSSSSSPSGTDPPDPLPGEFADLIPETLRTDRFFSAWSEFCEHRREKRCELTVRAARMTLKNLAAVGVERACAAIEMSIANQWQGVFPERVRESEKERFQREALALIRGENGKHE